MKELKTNLKFMWKYAKSSKKLLFYVVILNIILVATSVVGPILSAKAIIALTEDNLTQILLLGLIMMILNMIRNFFNLKANKIYYIIHKNTLSLAEIDVGSEILKISSSCIDKHGSGVFIQRINSDVAKITDIIEYSLSIIFSIIRHIGIFVAIFIINMEMFVYLLIVGFISFAIEKMRASQRNERDKEARKQKEKVSGFVTEIVRGQTDIRLLNSEKNFIKELGNRITKAYDLDYKMRDVSIRYRFYTSLFDDISGFGTIALLVYFLSKGSINGATALVLYNYSDYSYGFAFLLGNLMENIKDFNLSCNRVRDIFFGKEFEKEVFGKKHKKTVNGDFEFKDVEFYYKKNKPVLKDLNFKIKANETVAFVGKSGSGKSTIFNLICRMYDPVNGTITLDGDNLATLDKETLRGNITVISQAPYIFNMTIRENLKIVKDGLSDEDMIKYAKMSCFDEFVNTLPDGYDTVIGEGGINLSGGERQRLAITRALLQESKIVLFDEATSSLDNVTQGKIQEAIENMKDKYTVLIIAHRLSTVINADRILYLEDGKIKNEGTHKELLKTCKEYKTLYEKEIKSNK